jgi:hypothetical protein
MVLLEITYYVVDHKNDLVLFKVENNFTSFSRIDEIDMRSLHLVKKVSDREFSYIPIHDSDVLKLSPGQILVKFIDNGSTLDENEIKIIKEYNSLIDRIKDDYDGIISGNLEEGLYSDDDPDWDFIDDDDDFNDDEDDEEEDDDEEDDYYDKSKKSKNKRKNVDDFLNEFDNRRMSKLDIDYDFLDADLLSDD